MSLSSKISLLSLIVVSTSVAAWQFQVKDVQGPGTLVSIGAMHTARAAHTATPLPDGRILLAGGMTDEGRVGTSAELFDPESRSFTPTGAMHTLRQSHTATLLSDNRVLITGGYNAAGAYLSSAEIYDPSSGKFTPAGPMHSARAGHLAVKLRDNRVLLIGGVGTGWTFLASAEVYDHTTGVFTPVGAMSSPRESHVSVRLADGRVLVFGGHVGRRENMQLYTSVEVFDPVTGKFSDAGHMDVRRHKHDAVLLPDGNVLITGGTDERDFRGRYNSSEIFDPASGTSRAIAEMQLPRYKHAGTSIVLSDGRVLVAGGAPEAEVYDPASGAFERVKSRDLMVGQFSAAAAFQDGVLVTGGYGEGKGPQASAWVYRP